MSRKTFSLAAFLNLARTPRHRKQVVRRKSEEIVAVDSLEVRQLMSAVSVGGEATLSLQQGSVNEAVDSLGAMDDDSGMQSVPVDITAPTSAATVSLLISGTSVQIGDPVITARLDEVFKDYDLDLSGNVPVEPPVFAETKVATDDGAIEFGSLLNESFAATVPNVNGRSRNSDTATFSAGLEQYTQSEVLESEKSDFAKLVKSISDGYELNVESIRKSAESERVSVQAWAEEQVVAAQQQGDNLLNRVVTEYEVKVNAANSEADATIAASKLELDTRIAAADNEAALALAFEAARRDSEISRQTDAADQKIAAEMKRSEQAIRKHNSEVKRRLEDEKLNAANQTSRAHAARDAEIREARSWGDRMIAKLPSWARGIGKYLAPILDKVESTVDSAVARAKSVVKDIQKGLARVQNAIRDFGEQVVRDIRTAASKAISTIRDVRDQLTAAANRFYTNASQTIRQVHDKVVGEAKAAAASAHKAAVSTRDYVVTSAEQTYKAARKEIHTAVSNTVNTVRSQVIEKTEKLLAKTKGVLSDAWDATRNELVRVTHNTVEFAYRRCEAVIEMKDGLVENFKGAVKDFVTRAKEASSPLEFGKALWGFAKDVAIGTAQEMGAAHAQMFWDSTYFVVNTVMDLAIPDAIVRPFMQQNKGLYVDVDAKPHAILNSQLGGTPFYYINGMETKLRGNNYGQEDQDVIENGQATEQAEALSLKLGREVQLIWNRTEGAAGDLIQSVGDRLWQPIVPQMNPATRQLAGILLRHAERGENVSLCAHSQGNLIVRNALRTLNDLGYENWVRDQVRWVGAGSPLTHMEVDFPVHFTRVVNVGDPINAIGQTQELAKAGRENPFGIKEHSMIRSYVAYMAPSMFWSAENDYRVGTVPEGVDSALYAKHRSIWADRAGLKPIITVDATLKDVADTILDVMIDAAVESVVDTGIVR